MSKRDLLSFKDWSRAGASRIAVSGCAIEPERVPCE